MKNNSFTAASSIPYKIIINDGIVSDVKHHSIKPIHIQLNPTNTCNFKCSFCSCKNRNVGEELDFKRLKETIEKFYKLGTRAITITGGGEPLCYSHINDFFQLIINEYDDIKIGLTTNGVLLPKLNNEYFKRLTWCRISVSDIS